MPQAHALTVRLPGSAYRAAKRLAKLEGMSINMLVCDAITEKAKRSAARRLSKAYDLLGGEAGETDVESLLSAQVEALLDD